MADIAGLFRLCRTAAESTLTIAAQARDAEEVSLIQEVLRRIEQGPVRVTIFGHTSSGKSTIINALTGQITVPEGAGITTAVPTYIMGDAKAVKRGNIKYYKVHFASDDEEDLLPGMLCEVAMGRASFLTTKNHSPSNKDELERFMAKNSPHYRAVVGSEEMEEHYISIIDTPGIGAGGSEAENTDTKELLRELDNGFELLIYTVKTDSILEDDREVICQCLEKLKRNAYFDKYCLFAVGNKEQEYDKETMFAFVDGLRRYFGEYSDTKDRFYYFSALIARLKRAGIYNFSEYLPDGFTSRRGDDEEKSVEEQKDCLKLIEDEPLEELEADFVKFRDDLFAQAKKIGDDPVFIVDTVGPLFEQISRSADKLRNSEIGAVERQYEYDPGEKLPDFGEEELKELSKRRTVLWHMEKKLPGADDSLTRLKGRMDELETMSREAPGAIGRSVQEVIDVMKSWQTAVDMFQQPDFGNADLSRLSAAIRDAKEIIQNCPEREQLCENEISFEQIARDFGNRHSCKNNYNCSKEEIWYCKENNGQMDSWFLERVDTDTLPLIYDTIQQDFEKISETVRNDLADCLGDDLNKNDVSELRTKQYYSYSEFIFRVNSFMDTYVQDESHQKFVPVPRSSRQLESPAMYAQELSTQDLIERLTVFVNDRVPIIRQDEGFFKKIQAAWVRADFGWACARKITSFFDSEVQKFVTGYYQKLEESVRYGLGQDADEYIAAMTDPMDAISSILEEFERTHEGMSLALRKELEENAKELMEKCADAVKRLHECVEDQKREIMQQYSDGVAALRDNQYAKINDRYADIDNALREVARNLEELKTVI